MADAVACCVVSARHQSNDPTARLRRALGDLPGVAVADVGVHEDGRRSIRIEMDGSVASDLVADAVRTAIAADAVDDDGPTTRRKSGLGRGLDVLLADTSPVATPNGGATVPVSVAVTRGPAGTMVRVSDRTGAAAVVVVPDDTALDDAVVSAVATLRDEEPPTLVGVDCRFIGGVEILTVVVDGAGPAVGAAVVESDRLPALARAVWEALER